MPSHVRSRSSRTPVVAAVSVLALVSVPLVGWAAARDGGGGSAPAFRLATACGSGALLRADVAATGVTALRAGAVAEGAQVRWQMEPTDGGFQVIRSVLDGRLVDVAGHGSSSGVPVIAWTPNGGANQQWRLEKTGPGLVRLVPRHAPGMSLALQAGVARLAASGPGCATQWRVQPVGAGSPASTPAGSATPMDHSTHMPMTSPSAPSPAAPSGSPSRSGPPSGSPSPSRSQARPSEPSPAQASGATVSAGGTLRNPLPGMGLASTLTIPRGEPGWDDVRITPARDPRPSDIGASRFSCKYSHMGFDDPIVKPGRPGASHLHVFFGNVDVNAFSTPDSVATTGRSTCDGGIANRSAYWVPALYDTRTGQPLKPSFSLMYYKTGYGGVKPSEVKAMPSRLRIVAGDPNATGAQPHISWGCLNGGKPDLPGTLSTSCAPGDGALTLAVGFPQCWNGKDLDSPDHQSHMAYASGGCPATHPVALPQITINVRYTITTPGEQRFWRLSSDMYDRSIPGGRSLHGDWMNGWVPEIQQRWISTCQNKSLDCGSELGNGTRLRSE